MPLLLNLAADLLLVSFYDAIPYQADTYPGFTWAEHVNSYLDLKGNSSYDVLTVKYEDLHRAPLETLVEVRAAPTFEVATDRFLFHASVKVVPFVSLKPCVRKIVLGCVLGRRNTP